MQNTQLNAPVTSESPISLDQPGAIASQRAKYELRNRGTNLPPESIGVLPLEAKLDMGDAHNQQRPQSPVHDLPVGAIELGDGGEDEGHGHVLDEIAVGPHGEVERIRTLGVDLGRRGFVTQELLVLQALHRHTGGEETEVGCEWERPDARDGCSGRRS